MEESIWSRWQYFINWSAASVQILSTSQLTSFLTEIEKLILNSYNVTGPGLRLRLKLQSEILCRKGSQKNNREMTSIPKFCPGLILCPGGRERNPLASVLCYKDFWAQRSV